MIRRPNVPALLVLLALGALARPVSPVSAAATNTAAGADSALALYDGGGVWPREFAVAWALLTPTDRPPGDALKSRQAFLGQVVDRKLIAREATSRPFTLTDAESTEISRVRDNMTQNALFAQMTKDVPQPTDADIDQMRRQKSTFAEVRFVSFADEQRARSWRSKLSMGSPWASLDAAIAREGAALAEADTFRFVAAEQLPDTLAQVIWAMRPGSVSEILMFAGHPTILQLRNFLNRPDYSAISNRVEDLRTEYLRRIYDRIRERYRQDLAARLDRRFDDDGMRFLLEAHLRLPPRNEIDSLTGVPVTHTTMPLPRIAPEDTGRVIARLKGRNVTIGEYLAYWAKVQPIARPELREISTLQGAVDRVALAPEILRVAREQGLDQDPEALTRLARMREGYALDHWFNEVIQPSVKYTEADLKRFFDSKPGYYDDRAAITSHIIVTDAKSTADSVLTLLRGGASFSDLARAVSTDAATGAQGGDAGVQYKGSQANAGLEDAMFATPVGQFGGPERTPQGFVVWRIDSHTPGVKRTYDEAHAMVERDYKILEADKRVEGRLAELRKQAHVKLFPERMDPKLGSDGPWGD